jgi:chorismate mutase
MNDADTLARFRDSIDNIDAALVFMLAERFKITQAVGEFKAKSSLSGFGNWHAKQSLTPISPKNSCAS